MNSNMILDTQYLIDMVDEVVLIFDESGTILYGNNKVDEWLPCSRAEMVGKNVRFLTHENYTRGILTIEEVITRKETVFNNVLYSNGKLISYTGKPAFNNEGTFVGGVLTGRDMSYLVKLYKEQTRHPVLTTNDELIGNSREIGLVRRQILNAAKTDAPVMIIGESGTGKEVVARAIYKNSGRADKPFIAINCSAIPMELVEAELFGYEEGAFTGARKKGKKGLLESANGGTVFLDEIGTIPKHLQSKFLRVIQENKIMRVGGIQEIDLDIRYISATNLTLSQLRDENYFRQDLYYRLCVIPIQIPPLRQRTGDAEQLAAYFVEYFNKLYMKHTVLTDEVLDLIRTSTWPGNVRELRNIMERLVITSDDDNLNAEDYKLVTSIDAVEDDGQKTRLDLDDSVTLDDAYKMVDQVLITRAVERMGSVRKAAKLLGINRSTLYRKIQESRIDLDKIGL
ncbi:MAG: sigma 54-interacting transcriptional regulator [Eubacteriales bacterium]|nr:sigma 54-interacting transcriptional regulator [Eubacteriales bacterium]